MQALGGVNFDLYTWRARVLPIFIALFPLGIGCALWIPNVLLVTRVVGSLAGPFGLAMLLSQIGRDQGYRKQPALWQRWGGSPTVQLLRHSNQNTNPVIRRRYHLKLASLRPDLKIPTHDEELRDPVNADHVYEACAQYLIGKTRDHKRFPLVFKENINYGFRRNLWGIRPFGIMISALALAGCLLRLWVMRNTPEFQPSMAIVAALASLIFLFFWTASVTEDWVRIPADAYATRLLETCEELNEG